MIRNALSIALIAGLLAAPTFAQDAAIDVNGDEMYSFPEVLAVMPDMSEAEFMALDANGDGLLDVDEIAAGIEAGVLPATDG